MHAWEGDPRLKPTPDYGSVGSASDVPPDRSLDPRAGSWRVLLAVAAGILLAMPFATGTARGVWSHIAQFLTLRGSPKTASTDVMSGRDLDSQSPQKQAEVLLESAINHHDEASDQIAARVERWQGRLQLNPHLNGLLTAAFNSDDMSVRAAGIEVDLAALGIAKTPESVERLSRQAQSGTQSQRIWALWKLGLLGNRGVEPERVNQILVSHLRDADPEVRHWAVEGLAYLGTNESIAPLLQELHDDPSPMVRERAACSLAQSGMLTREQRHSAVSQLVNDAGDASLDAQTHAWVYHALRDITGQSLPDQATAWRDWYSANGGMYTTVSR
jgi:HEAT repeat protein